MTRKKKSRKPGTSGAKAKTLASDISPKKARKGNAPGSRHSMQSQKTHSNGQSQNEDPKKGSARKIALGNKTPEPVVEVKPEVTPKPQVEEVTQHDEQLLWEQELLDMENDLFMEEILGKLDDSEELDDQEQSYFDNYMARHQQLCDLLGIDDE